MKFRLLLLSVSLFAVAALPARSQQPPKPLTQEQIISLVRAGMETSERVKLIHDHSVGFDPSDDCLPSLRQAGAQEPVMEALRAARPKLLSEQQLLELLAAHVPNERATELVNQRGIDFFPDDAYLDMPRLAGANDALVAAGNTPAAGGRGAGLKPGAPEALQRYMPGAGS